MFRFSESSSETNHFIFFDDYEEERFEEFGECRLENSEDQRRSP